jgi:hypothetical protein
VAVGRRHRLPREAPPFAPRGVVIALLPRRAEELREQVRREFEAGRGAAEPYAQKFLLSDARARLKQLREMLGMQL